MFAVSNESGQLSKVIRTHTEQERAIAHKGVNWPAEALCDTNLDRGDLALSTLFALLCSWAQ